MRLLSCLALALATAACSASNSATRSSSSADASGAQPSSASSQSPAGSGHHHWLKATPDNVQWGWLDPREKPRLTIESGDTVSIETLMHSMDQIQKGTSMDKIVELRKANPGGGPHSLTG
ncbi:MAG TPA: hypothetical protein VGH20_08780, partial [Myxococcales bacterium]